MEYEKIGDYHRSQSTGLRSPSKLRMKLMGSRHSSQKHERSNYSSTTPPKKLDDFKIVENSLLARSTSGDRYEEGVGFRRGGMESFPIGSGDSVKSSVVHPLRTPEEENLEYDSNASSSSFEFHGSDRLPGHPIFRTFSRSSSSKWNDAEKWIVCKHNKQPNYTRKGPFHYQTGAMPSMNIVRVAPESAYYSTNPLINFSTSKKGNQKEIACHKYSGDTDATPGIRSVCMRDMGTEMTPVPSQEPSVTTTPIRATSPLRSPSSKPSSPRRDPTPTPTRPTTQRQSEPMIKEISEQELKIRTRREIQALGVQLGKMNIAAWASREEKEMTKSSIEPNNAKMEFRTRAAAWEEAERSKYTARYKRQVIKIEVWERRQRSKLDTEMRKIEAKIEQTKAQAQAKMVKKISMVKQRSEEKLAVAEARKNREAERTASEGEYIRQTGVGPRSHHTFCSWFADNGIKKRRERNKKALPFSAFW